MKTTITVVADDIALGQSADDTQRSGIARRLAEIFAAVRKASADRALRTELAELDVHTLRDIGIADDEIQRVRSREAFTPRAWRE